MDLGRYLGKLEAVPERGRSVDVVLLIVMVDMADGGGGAGFEFGEITPSSVKGRCVIPETRFRVTVLVSGVSEDLLAAVVEEVLVIVSTEGRGAVPACCLVFMALSRRLSLETFLPCLSSSLELLSLCITSAKALPTDEKLSEYRPD